MPLSTRGMILEKEHPLTTEHRKAVERLGESHSLFSHSRESDYIGVQRLYRWGDFGLSAIDPPLLHTFPFAWEFGVIEFDPSRKNLDESWNLTYQTALSSDVVVTYDLKEAEEFLATAEKYFSSWWRQQWLHLKGILRAAYSAWITEGWRYYYGDVPQPDYGNIPHEKFWEMTKPFNRTRGYFGAKHESAIWR